MDEGAVPLVGSLLTLLKQQNISKAKGDNMHPAIPLLTQARVDHPEAKAYCCFMGNSPCLFIQDVEAVKDLYTV